MEKKEIGKLLEKEKEKSELEGKSKDELVQELNQLSNDFPRNKSRMVEIAKVLLARHYGYLPRNKNKNGNDEMGKMSEGDKKNLK